MLSASKHFASEKHPPADLHPPSCSAMVSLFLKECDRQPAMTFSLFGDKFTRHAGITRLMED
ncbi:hypothetical protein, partial [Cronobacter sakazakii]|uniref:hypothetical protein n=1 Tax=Cronobacter sakazakii TaxID=28141 RepID=UPI0034DACDFD